MEFTDLAPLLARFEQWHGTERLVATDTLIDGRRPLVLGCPLWGDTHIDRFERYCLPSLLARENAATLRRIGYVLLYTNEADRDRLLAARARLMRAGVPCDFGIIPTDMLAVAQADRRLLYALLGTVHCVIRSMAGRRGLGFHMLQPDHVYSRRFFPSLERLMRFNQTIVQSAVSADFAGAAADLEAFRTGDGALEVDARALGALGYRHLHRQMHWMQMTAEGRSLDCLPRSAWLAWRARDALWIHTPHRHPVYLSAERWLRTPITAPHTLDTRLPWLSDSFYVPTPADDMAYIELSASEKGHDEAALDFDAFALNWWSVTLFKDRFLEHFAQPTRVALDHDPAGLPGWRIRWQVRQIVKRLQAAKPQAMERFIAHMTGTED